MGTRVDDPKPARRYIPPKSQKSFLHRRYMPIRVVYMGRVPCVARGKKDTCLYKKDTSYSEKDQVKWYKYDTRTIQVQYKIDLNEIDKRNPDRLGENEKNIKTKDNF